LIPDLERERFACAPLGKTSFIVEGFLCASVSLWLMVLGLLHQIHPSGERLMFVNLLFLYVFAVLDAVNRGF
jgi:hypothetical protein